MSEHILVGLTAVIVLGISAQWLVWRSKLPAILLLLGLGIVAGPLTGLLDPDKLIGDLLSPFVSISVAIILFGERTLFGSDLNFGRLNTLFQQNYTLETLKVEPDFSLEGYKKDAEPLIIPLFLISNNEVAIPFSLDTPPPPQEGDHILSLVHNDKRKEEKSLAQETTHITETDENA